MHFFKKKVPKWEYSFCKAKKSFILMGIRISCSSGDIYKDVKRGTVPLIKKGIWTQYSFFFFFWINKRSYRSSRGYCCMHFYAFFMSAEEISRNCNPNLSTNFLSRTILKWSQTFSQWYDSITNTFLLILKDNIYYNVCSEFGKLQFSIIHQRVL